MVYTGKTGSACDKGFGNKYRKGRELTPGPSAINIMKGEKWWR
jgi:hypothetical protein